jgi:predicted transglutaminase-like cysteine proteinase
MKKGLLKLLLAGTILSSATNIFSQKIKEISPKKVQGTEINIPNESYETKLNKINAIKYNDYKDMLSEVKDVEDAEIYCTKVMQHAGKNSDKIMYGKEDYWASFKQSYYLRLQDCDDATVAAAALLQDNGFHPYFLKLDGKESGHMVFLYKDKEGKFGTIGINDVDCKRPESKNIEDLFKEFNKDYNEKFLSYKILDAQEIFPDAIDKEQDYSQFY